MKNILILLLVLAALMVGAYFFVFRKANNTLPPDETAFSVKDTASVAKIFIADMSGNKVTLQRTDSDWIVNNMYPVRSDYINILLTTIHDISLRNPVATNAEPNVLKQMSAKNTKVEIYDKTNHLLKSYFVGGASLDSKGTYMMLTEARHPVITAIPGFEGTLDTRYATDMNDIRGRNIYSFRPYQLTSVTVNYAGKPDSSFTIFVVRPDSFRVQNLAGKILPAAMVEKNNVSGYLQLYRWVNCEGYVNNISKKDSILQTTPFCTITVTDRAMKSYQTILYHMPKNQTSQQYNSKGQELPYDIDHYFATINGGPGFCSVAAISFRKIVKNISLFYEARQKHFMKQFIHSFGESSFLISSFCIIVLFAVLMEIIIFLRQQKTITVPRALLQTIAWIALGLSYGYLMYTDDTERGLQFFSAYLTEYSLSADNLFVFILIFSFFSVSEKYIPKVLLIGIIGAVLLRILFILVGISIVNQFHWILYIFGAVLVYTGIRIFFSKEEKEFDPKKNMVYRWMSKTLPLVQTRETENSLYEEMEKNSILAYLW